MITEADLTTPASPPSPDGAPVVVLIVPQDWHEMASWLPRLRGPFGSCPWLVLADLRIAGIFLSHLKRQRCALMAPSASPEEVRAALRSLVEGGGGSPTDAPRCLFARGAPLLAGGRHAQIPTRRELECGCAISLGLCNAEIAAILRISEGTAKSHVHNLLEKLELSSRRKLGLYVARALTVPVPSWVEGDCEETSPEKMVLARFWW